MTRLWYKNYEPSVAKEVDLNAYSSINHIFEETFKKFGEAPAFHNMGTTINFRELNELGRKFGDFLLNELKLMRGDRLAIMMPNVLQYPIALVGAMGIGKTIAKSGRHRM